eukprot:6481482-Amphidinium_carterae.2
MDQERKPYEVCFGQSAKKFQLMDHIGPNTKPVAPSLTLADLACQIIIQRRSTQHRFMALQAGLPDEKKKAFADAQELGAWTMDLLWNEVLNRIDRVTAYSRKDDPTFKLKKKENPKGYRVVPQAHYMKLIKGEKVGNNEERLANYFETGATFALFQRDLYSIRRLLIALISHLPKKEEEAFWQWYPAYGYQFPHYNTVTDKAQREVHSTYDDWEGPFTSANIPEGYFTEKPEQKRDQSKAIPVVPDFVAKPRAKASEQETRVSVIPTETKEHAHGYFTFTDHKKQIGWYGYVSDEQKNKYWEKMQYKQRIYQKIELQTAMRFYRKMTPTNDVFKIIRCQAIVKALEEAEYDCCDADYLVFEGQEREWKEELKNQRTRDTCPSNLMMMRRDGIAIALRVMQYGIDQPFGSSERDLAAEVCHSIRIINNEFRDVVADIMYKLMKEDQATIKRYVPGWHYQKEWETLKENAERNGAFESKASLMNRRFNGSHCSYFHRWFQHPIWRLSQARVGNGPYTLASEFGEPVHNNFEIASSNCLPDLPSRQAYAEYQKLLNDWDKKIEIPKHTHQDRWEDQPLVWSGMTE